MLRPTSWLLMTLLAGGEPPGNGAIRFRAGAAELVIADASAFDVPELTIELWARIDGVQAEHAQFVRKLTSHDQGGFLFAASQSGYGCVQFRFSDDRLRTLPDSLLATWYRGQWHHFAAVHGRQRVLLYVDGVEVARHERAKPCDLVQDLRAPLRIGVEGFVGEMDELRIWRVPRSRMQIEAGLYKTVADDEPDLIRRWSFDEAIAGHERVVSGAPLESSRLQREHRTRFAKIEKGRLEVENVAATLPPLNARIYRFATSLANEAFGSGDCWNFVQRAMDMAGASRRDLYVFGGEVKRKDALPGDLIHFAGFRSPGFSAEQHSAILWRRDDDDVFTVIHQNAPPNGAKVGLLRIDLRKSTGTIRFFRPE